MADISNLPAEKASSVPFQVMDLMDDRLIVQELEGRLPDILTYHFQGRDEKGKEITIWGLSKSGVDEATAELATKKGEVIRELELIFTDGKDEGFFQVKSGRFAVMKDGKEIMLDTKFGNKRQPKKYRSGGDNPFWYEQGCMKAARNAAMRLIPETIKQAVIEYAKEKGKTKNISDKDAEELKPEDKEKSDKAIVGFIDFMKKSKNLAELGEWWKKYNKKAKEDLTEEHFAKLVSEKDALKEKYTKEEK